MAIPDFQSIFKPLLDFAATRKVVTTKDAFAAMKQHFSVSDEEFNYKLPSGTPVFKNRVQWAKQYLVFAKLVEGIGHGTFQVTPLGREWSVKKVQGFKIADFRKVPGFNERINPSKDKAGNEVVGSDKKEPTSPLEEIDAAVAKMQQALTTNLLDRIHRESPRFFEELVLDVIQGLGYGAGVIDSAHHTGKGGDGGIDGFINMDHLGLERIYLQAKRYGPEKKPVTREQVAAFVGSMPGDKGIFVTTGTFAESAREFARQTAKRLVLIDGADLCKHLFKTKRAVRVMRTYEIYEIDEDYFVAEE